MESLADSAPSEHDAVQDLHKPEEIPVKKDVAQTPEVCMDSWFLGLSQFGPLQYVLKLLQKVAAALHLSVAEKDCTSTSRPSSPTGRRCVSGKKRLGRLLRVLFSIMPHWLQYALGYPMPKDIGGSDAPDEVKKSPLIPWGKGSKRKQDDVDLEEQQSWIEALEEDLPDEDDEDEDPTYEPSKSETDSEEHRSKNNTESDLEFEEKDGVVVLKESQDSEEVKVKEESETAETCVQEVEELGTSGTCVQEQNSSVGERKNHHVESKADIQDSPQPGVTLNSLP